MGSEAELFAQLCELPAEARAVLLKKVADEDADLAGRLQRLLAIDAHYAEHTARRAVTIESLQNALSVEDFGAFRITKQIAAGGMGVVYLAQRSAGFAQEVAIKVLPQVARDEERRRRFTSERQLLAQLKHPNICQVIDGGELADGSPYLVMEFVAGVSLCTWCRTRHCSVGERIGLFLQLCDAVDYAHQNLIVHRDIKDANVIVNERGELKLLDFGIAKSLQQPTDLHATTPQTQFFSPLNAAPEQIRGERPTVGIDVYALGTLLHQLLSGELPFEQTSPNPAALHHDVLHTTPPLLSRVIENASLAGPPAQSGASASIHEVKGDLEAIVARCLEKAAQERYPTVAAFAADLRAYLSGHPISALRGQRWYRVRKFLSRNRGGVVLGAIAVSSLLMASIAIAWQASRLRIERDVAQQAQRQSEVDRDRARAVADFLRNTFEAADPNNATQGGLRAHELVDHAVQRLAELSNQAETQGELALLMAESYAQMGLIGKSADVLNAHQPVIDSLGSRDPEIRWREKILALKVGIQIQRDLNRVEAQLLDLGAYADTLAKKVQLAHLQADWYSRRSEFARAASSLEAAWRQFQNVLEPAERLRLRVALGQAMLASNRDAEAYEISQEIRRTALTGYAPELQILALRFVARESRMNDQDPMQRREAIERWQRTAERLYGADSLHAASAYVWRVGVTGDALEREQLVQRAYTIQRAKLPEISSAMAYAEYNMAAYYEDSVRSTKQAEPHFARAVLIGRQIFSRSHGDVRLFEQSWAQALNRLGRHREVLDRLSHPPGDPSSPDDRIKLYGLHLELAHAALVEGQLQLGRKSLGDARALWREAKAQMPTALAQRSAELEEKLARLQP